VTDRSRALERLAQIAPITAVRGNNDMGAWADDVPESRYFGAAAVSARIVELIAPS
jgi:uncharacterized protein